MHKTFNLLTAILIFIASVIALIALSILIIIINALSFMLPVLGVVALTVGGYYLVRKIFERKDHD